MSRISGKGICSALVGTSGKGICSALVGTNEVSFPEGLRVMAIDSNPVSLLTLVAMLRRCQYEVTARAKATEALEMLRQNRCRFDIVVTAMVGLDLDGFTLLEFIVSKLDIPVVIASASDNQQVIMRVVLHGACDFLLKPVSIRVLQNIWQHVARRQLAAKENSCRTGNRSSFKIQKKLVWSDELHLRFIEAARQLGIDSASPREILAHMKVRGLTTRQVSSHLQTYRKWLREHYATPNRGNQGGSVLSLDAMHRRYCNARMVGRIGSPLIINQVNNCTINPSSVSQPALLEYRQYPQRVQTPWFEHQPLASDMINQVTVSDPQELSFSTARFERIQSGNQIGSHSEHFRIDVLQEYRPHMQQSEGPSEISRARMGSGFGGTSVDHSHMFPGNSRRDMYYGESSYQDDELAVMIDQFNVDEAPKL